jgi:hypothetical protein
MSGDKNLQRPHETQGHAHTTWEFLSKRWGAIDEAGEGLPLQPKSPPPVVLIRRADLFERWVHVSGRGDEASYELQPSNPEGAAPGGA